MFLLFPNSRRNMMWLIATPYGNSRLTCTYTMVTVQTLANTEANIKQPQSFQSSEKMIDCGFSVFCSLLINIGRLGWQDTLRKVMF